MWVHGCAVWLLIRPAGQTEWTPETGDASWLAEGAPGDATWHVTGVGHGGPAGLAAEDYRFAVVSGGWSDTPTQPGQLADLEVLCTLDFTVPPDAGSLTIAVTVGPECEINPTFEPVPSTRSSGDGTLSDDSASPPAKALT